MNARTVWPQMPVTQEITRHTTAPDTAMGPRNDSGLVKDKIIMEHNFVFPGVGKLRQDYIRFLEVPKTVDYLFQ